MSLIKRDWDDFLSPILIKELRQGLREPSFVISFVALQAGLAFLIFIGLGSDLDPSSMQSNSIFFHGALCLTFLLVLPARGLVSLSQERRQNTLETMLLTRLSAKGVVLGKWTALVFQGFLLATTVLPYVMIRYLTGGGELLANLVDDTILFWGFLLVSSVCVGLSAVNMIFSRIVSFIGVLVFILTILSATYTSFSTTGSGLDLSFQSIVWGFLYLIFVPMVIFDLAAASVGSMAEGGVVRRRLTISLFLYVLCSVQYIFPVDSFFFLGICAVIGVCVIEIGQYAEIKERNLEPFVRYGFIGKVTALVFLPGWQSGMVYAMITLPICLIGILTLPTYPASGIQLSDGEALSVAVLGSIMIPLVFIIFFLRTLRMRCFLIALINVVSSLVCLILEVTSSSTSFRPLDILTFFPTVSTLMSGGMLNSSANSAEEMGFIIKGGVVDVFLLGVLMVSSIPWLKTFNESWQAVKLQQRRLKSDNGNQRKYYEPTQ